MEYRNFGPAQSAAAPVADPGFESIGVDHQAANFTSKNGFTKSIQCVALGLIRQRELWVDGTSGRKIACESTDAQTGFAKANLFDYEAAGFDRKQFPGPPSGEIVNLRCEDCEMRKWRDRKPPACTASWVVPFITANQPLTEWDSVPLKESAEHYKKRVFLLPVKYSSQRVLENYLVPFRDSRTPTYTVRTRIDLSRRMRNNKTFSEMSFTSLEKVPEAFFPYLSEGLRTVREIITAPPTLPTGSFSPMRMGGP